MSIYGLTREELEQYFLTINEKKFKALQIFEWLYQKKERNIANFSNIKKEIRERLQKDFSFDLPTIVKREIDEDVEKFLFKLSDSEHIEAVLMRQCFFRGRL